MLKRIVYLATAFVLFFLTHVVYYFLRAPQVKIGAGVKTYFNQQDFFVSFAFALVGSFIVYALMRFLEERRLGLISLLGGFLLAGALGAVGLFLLGCCSFSPMHSVYTGIFGSSFLKLTKPLIATVTILSVAAGAFWIERRLEAVCEECQID